MSRLSTKQRKSRRRNSAADRAFQNGWSFCETSPDLGPGGTVRWVYRLRGQLVGRYSSLNTYEVARYPSATTSLVVADPIRGSVVQGRFGTVPAGLWG